MEKMKTWNRLLSMVLCVCMVLSLMPGIPLTVFAADDCAHRFNLDGDIKTPAACSLCGTTYSSDSRWVVGTYEEVFLDSTMARFKGHSQANTDEIVAYYVAKTVDGIPYELCYDWAVNQGYTQYGQFEMRMYHNDQEVIVRAFTGTANPYRNILSEKYTFEAEGDVQVFKFVFRKTNKGTWADSGRHAYLNNIAIAVSEVPELVDGSYQIGTIGQLYWFAQQVNGGDRTANAVLTADLDLKGSEWTTICSTGLYYDTTAYTDSGYTGTFDGQGHVISNFTTKGVSGTKCTVGLFGTAFGATVKNLGIANMTFDLNGATDVRAAGIVGQMLEGTLIENCYVINSTLTPNNYIVGGVAACNYGGTIRNCFTKNVAVSGHSRCGNLVSDTRGDINSTDRPGNVINCWTDAARVAGTQSGGRLTDCQENVSADRFASGEVAYMLGDAFGQTVGQDTVPVLGGAKIYYGYVSCADNAQIAYTNDENASPEKPAHKWQPATCTGVKTCPVCQTTEGEIPDHSYTNGFCIWCDVCEPAALNGDVYEISNAGQLYWFAEQVNSGNTGIRGKLTTDITVNENVLKADGSLNGNGSNFREWTPIGSSSCAYIGTFDGGDHTVSGLYYDERISDVGLFGYVKKGGTVCNVGVKASYIGGSNQVGAVVGSNEYGTVTNCYNTGTVKGTYFIGGVVGSNEHGTVANCYNTGIVSASEKTGGVVGETYYGPVTNCYNTGTVNGSKYIGGAVGENLYSTITNCYNTGTVIGRDINIGGVVGESDVGTIANCYNTGTVNGNNRVGGVVGYGYRTEVKNCYNTGTVEVKFSYIGGILGDSKNSTVTKSYYLDTCGAAGNGTAKTADQFAGGEVAYLLGESFGQTLGKEIYPILGGKQVFYGYVSCASTAVKIYTNDQNATSKKPAHTEKIYPAYDADCTNPGLTEGRECTVCGETLLTQTVIPAGHRWQDATCTTPKTCSVCGVTEGEALGHTGGTATCVKPAVCTVCGEEYGDKDCYNHVGPFTPQYSWTAYEDGTCYVYVELYCDGCGGYVDGSSGEAELTEDVVAQDCLTPGSRTWTYTATLNGKDYTETYTETVYSDNHIGPMENGFCPACGGYEAAKWNEEEYLYEISNAGQLYWYAQYLNTTNAEIYAKLTADIVIPENAPNWEPINASYAYFNGNFKTISGLKCIGGEERYVGLFGNEGWWYEISNLHIADSYFEGEYYVGALVALMGNGGSITNCYVTNTTVKGTGTVGTLVGHLGMSNVINCYVDTATLVGYHSSNYGGSIENSYYLSDTDDGNGGKTADQFASGEVAYLLQSGVAGEDIYDEDWNYIETVTPQIWGQTIGEDAFPGFSDVAVYPMYNCINEIAAGCYSNTEGMNVGHFYNNGFCTLCDALEPATGSGTEEDPYQIGNAGQLYWFAAQVSGGNTGICGKLTANITVNKNVLKDDGTLNGDGSSFRAWTPIGVQQAEYTGIFDGGDYTVSGLYIDDVDEYAHVGLFGQNCGTVMNVGVKDSYIRERNYVGGVVGLNMQGTVINCYNAGTVCSTNVCVGGVVGMNTLGTVANCYNIGSVIGNMVVGGVVGDNYAGTDTNVDDAVGCISNCYNAGTVSGSSTVGGVVGDIADATIVTNCYNTGTVTGETTVGGVVGCSLVMLTNCYNTGMVTGETDVGGVAGYSLVAHNNCYYLDTCGAAGEGIAKTAQQFASGEVTYLLNGDQSSIVFFQTCGEGYPAFSGEKVYGGYLDCQAKELTYTNDASIALDITNAHPYDNGFCTAVLADGTLCDACQPAVLNQGYYEISNAGQLYWFAAQVNSGNTGINGKLTADITVNENVLNEDGTLNGDGSGFRAWVPMGRNATYDGTFNGEDHSISGLYCNQTYSYVGLFSKNTGTVKKVGVKDSYFNGDMYVGAVVGLNKGVLENAYNTGTVIGNDNVGGVAGAFETTLGLYNCYNTGTVTGKFDVGGVLGRMISGGSVQNCHNTGNVTATGSGDVGGIVGDNAETAIVRDCYNTGTITGTGTTGGLFGRNYNTVSNCYNTGDVFGGGTTGGLFGSNSGNVTDCFSTGSVTGGNNTGGLFGSNDGNVTGCYSTGSVTGRKYTGGLSGFNSGSVTDCYSTGSVTGGDYTGGLIGRTTDSVSECYSDGAVSGGERVGGLIGYASANVTNSHNLGNVTGSGNEIGGLVGYLTTGTVMDCYNSGSVTATGSDSRYTGGVVGYGEGNISGCYNTGTVNANRYVGGVVGRNEKAVSYCYNTGNVISTNYTGGVSGYNNSTITYCYNTGSITGGSQVGGVVGMNSESLNNCYNTGNVTATEYVGGIIGYNNEPISNCYNTGEIISTGTSIGALTGYSPRSATVTNGYYLDTCGAAGLGTAKNAAAFTSGDVAYTLGRTWKQTLGQDATPNFVGMSVYKVLNCSGTSRVYSNTDQQIPHEPALDDGDCTTGIPCTVCGKVAIAGNASHTPAEDDGDCTTEVFCTVCGKVAIPGNASHTPVEDDGDCTTEVPCAVCGKVAIPGNANHTPAEDDGDCTTDVCCIDCDYVFVSGNASHTPAEDDGDCTTEVPCTVCDKAAIEAKAAHSYTDYVCDCGTVSSEARVVVTIGGNQKYFASFKAAIEAVKDCTDAEQGEVKLLADIANDIYTEINSGVFTLDLNGFELSTTNTFFEVLNIYNEGVVVTIVDSGKNGKISGIGQAISVCGDATLNIVSGTISAEKGIGGGGRGHVTISGGEVIGTEYGVEVMDRISVTITGGTVSGNTALKAMDRSLVTITGGTVSGNTALEVMDRSPATISGGNIQGILRILDTTATVCVDESGNGATFQGGITVEGTTLSEILGEGAAYRQNGVQLSLSDEQTSITGSDVVIMTYCDHSGSIHEDDGDCTTKVPCTVCGQIIAANENHTPAEDDGDCTTDIRCTVCDQVVIPGSEEHSWTDATCTTPKTCSVCGTTEGEPSGEHIDADKSGRCDFCHCLMAPAKLIMTSVSLKGNIAVNYYMLLSDEVLADTTAYMQFKLVDGEVRKIPVSQGVKMEVKGETYYVFSCAVSAKEMTDTILSQFFFDGGVTKEHPYTVQTYAEHILSSYGDEATKNLIKAMLNYGAASQLHFGYKTNKLANSCLDAAPDYSNVSIQGFDAVPGQGTELAKFYSASLILKSETTVRFFFQVNGSATFTATCNGQQLEVKNRNGLYYVDVVGISAKDLDENVTVTIHDGTDSTEVFFNPMSYCQGVLNDTTGSFTAEMKDLVRALSLYNQAANIYFKEG